MHESIRISAPVCEPGLPARARRTLAWHFTTAWDPEDNATSAGHYNARRALDDAHRRASRAAGLKAWRDGDPFIQAMAAPALAAAWADHHIRRRVLLTTQTWLRDRYRGRFVDYLDLDTQSRELLYRSQEAVCMIRTSAVLAAGMIDETESGLALQEWQIARGLADLPPGRPGEDAAWQAVRAHVEALEDYAHQVALADTELAAREGNLRAQADAGDPRLLDSAAARSTGMTTASLRQAASGACHTCSTLSPRTKPAGSAATSAPGTGGWDKPDSSWAIPQRALPLSRRPTAASPREGNWGCGFPVRSYF